MVIINVHLMKILVKMEKQKRSYIECYNYQTGGISVFIKKIGEEESVDLDIVLYNSTSTYYNCFQSWWNFIIALTS